MATNEITNGRGSSTEALLASKQKRRCDLTRKVPEPKPKTEILQQMWDALLGHIAARLV
jgi:hypothetical protein